MKSFVFLLLFSLSLTAGAQTLVQNSSFENATGACPITATDFSTIVNPWYEAQGIVNYFHLTCGNAGDSATTNNTIPFDGDGMIGIPVYGPDPTNTNYIRGYVGVQLSEALVAGRRYRFTFWVKPVINNDLMVGYGIDNIGAVFTDSIIEGTTANNVYELTPDVRAVNPVVDMNNWTAVCGIFTAKGGERYVTLGNFSIDSETAREPLNNAVNPLFSYALIDYLELVPNDLPELPQDTFICAETRIDINLSQPGVSVTWQDGDINTFYTITEPGTYWADIRSASCAYRDTMIVIDGNCDNCQLYIPNAFTPNGDNKNDIFLAQVEEGCNLESFKIQVYDRWGQKVFESINPNQGWDGANIDEMGVFTYAVEYRFNKLNQSQSISRKGTLTLIK